MRQLRVERPIGFFLHTPWAERGTMLAVPHHADLVQAMLAYDLVGFQTEEDQRNFEDYLQVELGLNVVNGTVASDWGVTRLGTFPIGIDFDEFAARATQAVTRPEIARLRASLQGAKLVLGVDRLDYSKGLANRMQAFDRMLAIEPSLKRNVSFLQIAVPTRGGIRAYRQLKSDLAALVGEVNGRHGEVDWSPIRYLNRGYAQVDAGRVLSGGAGRPGHAAARRNEPGRQGVRGGAEPVRSGRAGAVAFAGAAKQLDAALLVNPHDIDGMARQIAAALAMPLEERRERWHSMVGKLRTSSVQGWFADFLLALGDARRKPSWPKAQPIVLDLASRARAQWR